MDSIISKLSEVESAAELIVQHAEEQKHILDEQMKEKTDKFDRELAADTEKKLSEIRGRYAGQYGLRAGTAQRRKCKNDQCIQERI